MKRELAKKKLMIQKSTLRTLSIDAAQKVRGGQTLATCSDLCTDVVCPDTQFVHGCNSGD